MTQKVQLELYFWLFTLLVTAAVMLPILTSVPGYPFTFVNIVYVISGGMPPTGKPSTVWWMPVKCR